MFKFIRDWLRKKDDGMDAAVRAAIADDKVCAILRLVVENPGISEAMLADRSRLEPGVVRACLVRLTSLGLVEGDADGGYCVPEAAKPAVMAHLPLYYQCPGLKRE